MQNLVLSPSDFVALLNQTLETAYPLVIIEGELSNFRVSKNRWVYFDLQDEGASVKFFGSVYNLPGPLEDGLTINVMGYPRLHPRFGFSVNFQSIQPVGEGSLRKAADLLAAKLEAEGLFAPERKRSLPAYPSHIGLITARDSAAYADFIKIINARWSGLSISHIDVLVQGQSSPLQLVGAIEKFNQLAAPPEVIVMTRGGGSADDLAAFSDERVVRAVAASRIPMLVAIGHETDISLAELAADMRASTPTNAAVLVVSDKKQETAHLEYEKRHLAGRLAEMQATITRDLNDARAYLKNLIQTVLEKDKQRLASWKNLARLLDPKEALKRGYAIVSLDGMHIRSVKAVEKGSRLMIDLADGKIDSLVKGINNGY